MNTLKKATMIAQVCHAAVKKYSELTNYYSILDWDLEAVEWTDSVRERITTGRMVYPQVIKDINAKYIFSRIVNTLE